MLNINSMNTVADNSIVINGVEVARFNDTDTEKLLSIINGIKSGTTVAPVKTAEKKRYEYTKECKTGKKGIKDSVRIPHLSQNVNFIIITDIEHMIPEER